jgi:hypothetical protein
VLESLVFWLFDHYFELEHCHKNSPLQLGCRNKKFRGWSGLFPVLRPEKFPFWTPCFHWRILTAVSQLKNWKKRQKTGLSSTTRHMSLSMLLPLTVPIIMQSSTYATKIILRPSLQKTPWSTLSTRTPTPLMPDPWSHTSCMHLALDHTRHDCDHTRHEILVYHCFKYKWILK